MCIIRGFGRWVGGSPALVGLVGRLLQELMSSVILGRVLHTRIPSIMPVLDPPVYSELGTAELLGSLQKGKLSEP